MSVNALEISFAVNFKVALEPQNEFLFF
jgi:hypothetical protein